MRALSLLAILAASVAAEEATILHQDVTLQIDPKASTFLSKVHVRVRGPGTLTLPPGTTGGEATVPAGEHERVFLIRGTIKHPVRKSRAATWVAGDSTPGTIGPDGSYLVRGFYLPSGPCRFDVTIRVPLPHRAVSQGRRVLEEEKDGFYMVAYEGGAPADGLVVVTGPWEIDEKVIDGLSCRTYLYEADRQHAAILLASLEAEVPRYQKVFGKVPDGRFDIVENFFATGYGFPNFTLLGDTVIRYVCAKTARQRQKVLPSGYVDHELVHCWLGNHLHVDYEAGNWCEALTTYFTNYGAAVRNKTGAEYRRKVSRSFSLRVGEKNDYPLRAFKSKSHAYENDIGYGKGSMVFHMLAREIGADTFAKAVRHVVDTRGGQRLGWDALVKGLSESVGRDLAPWFKPWLERTGAPVLEIGRLHAGGTTIVGTIVQAQDGPAYRLTVPVRVITDGGVEEHEIDIGARESLFRIDTTMPARRVELDPDHHVFRRVPRAHVAPCLEAVRTADKRVGFGAPDLMKALDIESIEPSLPNDAAVLAIGLPADAALRRTMVRDARRADASLTFAETSFSFRGVTYDQPGDAIMISYARTDAPGLPVVLFHGNGEPAYARTHYLPYYASHSWVVFENGRPTARGTFPADRKAGADVTGPRLKPAESVIRDLVMLTDPAHEGRQAGGPASYKLANTLRGRLFRAGLKHVPWPPVAVPTGAAQPGRLTLGEQSYVLYPFHLSAAPALAPVFQRVVEHPADDVKKAMVILPEDAPTALAREYEAKGAAVVAVAATDKWTRAQEAAWDGALPPPVAKRTRGNVGLAVSGMMRRSWDKRLGVPYVYLSPEAAQAARAHEGRGVVTFSVKRSIVPTHNIVGILGDPKMPGGIVLGAHWDGVGRIGGKTMEAASDNAAGVAAVLWAAERLKQDFDAGRLKRPVVVVLFGGEEAGLCGSRQFVEVLAGAQSPLAAPSAMINVDGVGSHKDAVLYCIGRSYHPALFESFQRAVQPSGLAIGRDIDKFAFKDGSDHWPFHEAGVPAVMLFSADYRSMNGPLDTLDKVDIAMVRKVAHTTYRLVKELASR